MKNGELATWFQEHLINKTSKSPILPKPTKSTSPPGPCSNNSNGTHDETEASASIESPEASLPSPKPYYGDSDENPSLNVYNVISTFNADVCEYDQSVRYAEFLKPSSAIRIIVATTSLGMGVNVQDVERVVI